MGGSLEGARFKADAISVCIGSVRDMQEPSIARRYVLAHDRCLEPEYPAGDMVCEYSDRGMREAYRASPFRSVEGLKVSAGDLAPAVMQQGG